MKIPAFLLILFINKTVMAANIPSEFVDIKTVIPSIVLDMRYYTIHNFVGEKIDGYLSPKCLLTKPAAQALKKVQQVLEPFALSLKLYDCYRPQRAVKHFVKWAQELEDIKMKAEFYPSVDKTELFKKGYIAEKSSHSRGSTVDLTIVSIPAAPQPPENGIDMGTEFDYFDELATTISKQIKVRQRVNRLLLKTLMEKHGFENYPKEWWHFTLKNEPFPNTYFDFIIE
jgi:D-alanyl-D-alanine dipeptidase